MYLLVQKSESYFRKGQTRTYRFLVDVERYDKHGNHVEAGGTFYRSELVFVDYNSEDIIMDAKDATFKSVSYWSLGDIDYDQIKDIILQVILSKRTDTSSESKVRFNRTITF